ncbi:thiol-disulfide oxidoreductase DCC family protein [Gorillibacterium sp. sgz5001074]|uniref:thiol-disulfide oxidoreductase DCC family protein n=1 Tax=Gorillibacterium sp. sgz5001074 TaxID=3446695 RepID=UPI003F67B8CB
MTMTKRASQQPESLLLLYDGECNLCLATVEKLRRIRTTAQLHMQPLQTADPAQLPPGTSPEELLAELHLIDGQGRVYRGAASVVRILQTVPALAWLAPLYRVPGLRSLTDAVYRLIARHRYRLFGKSEAGCSTGACRLPARPGQQARSEPQDESTTKGESS